MSVHFDGKFFRVAYISGPNHNYSALRITESESPPALPIKFLPPVGPRRSEDFLSRHDVDSWVATGVANASKELGTCYRIIHAEVVEDDHPSPQVYTALAKRIVVAAHARANSR